MIKNKALLTMMVLSLFFTTQAFAQLSAEHVADKIVSYGYALVDACIKEGRDGVFYFRLNNDVYIEIYEIAGSVTITFDYPDDTSHLIMLNSPEAIAAAKETLTVELLDSEMRVKEINKEQMNLNLASTEDIQIFIDLMYDSIKLTTPLFTESEAFEAEVPKNTLVKVNPAIDEKPIEIAGISTIFKQVKTKINFGEEEKEIKINVDKTKKESKIEIDNKVAMTKERVEIKEAKLYLDTSIGLSEIKVSPKEALSKTTEVTTIKEIELKEDGGKPIYSIKGTKQAKILFIFPVTLEIEKKIDAEKGDIIAVKKPWWSFLAW